MPSVVLDGASVPIGKEKASEWVGRRASKKRRRQRYD